LALRFYRVRKIYAGQLARHLPLALSSSHKEVSHVTLNR
jgi:hypothetical protein